MNQLQVKTISLTPAVVEFNFDELSKVLDAQLAKYQDLEFTEEEVAECKKTITELNKGKKALSDYRIKTKKELTEAVTEFENQCKELSNKFDSVINPLKEQTDLFEENRKAEKAKKIQVIIDELLEKEGLNEKFGAGLRIEDRYLNKSTTMKSIEEELATKAEHLGTLQDKEDANREIIKSHVQLLNAQNNVNLTEQYYIRLLEFQDVSAIKELIEADAEKEKREDEVLQEEVSITASKHDELFREVYKVTGTESQLDALEEYMSSQGIAWVAVE